MRQFSNRSNFRWALLKGPFAKLAGVVGTGFGLGRMPFVPGSFGTLPAVPLVVLLSDSSFGVKGAFWFGLFVLGVWAARVIDDSMHTADNQSIVIDEIVGLGITAWTLPVSPNGFSLVVAFALFRFFDIAKLPPVRLLDKWSHSHTRPWVRAFFVIFDDCVAGLQALLIILVLQHFSWI